jgi:hypothetical protein
MDGTGGTSNSTSSTINVTWGSNRGIQRKDISAFLRVKLTKNLYRPEKHFSVQFNNIARKSTNIGFTLLINLSFNGDYVGISNSNLINLEQLITARWLWFKANNVDTSSFV